MKRFGWFGSLVAAIALMVHPAAARSDDLLNTLVNLVPPLLLSSDQPVVPANGYIWQPGYWAWSPDGQYYWVPGEWVLPPAVGDVWTPGYWAFNGNGYVWNPGYWDTQVGYYGGVDYGDGYYGNGYVGGRWYGDTYRYNRAVTHVNTFIRNVYIDDAVVVRQRDFTSFNGGRGIKVRPTAWQAAFAHRHHRGLTIVQQNHIAAAARDPHLRWTGSAEKIAPSIRVRGGVPGARAQAQPHAMHAQPMHVHTQPVHAQPVHTRPVHAQPVHTRPVHAQPVHAQPVHAQPVRTQPAHTQPAHTQPAHTQPAKTQPAPHPHGTHGPG